MILLSLVGGALCASFQACSLHYNAPSKDDGATKKKSSKAPIPLTYKISMPVNHGLESTELLDMLRTFNAGVGRDVLIIPSPFVAATSPFKWADNGDGLEKDACLGVPLAASELAMTVTFSYDYAKKFFQDRAHLADGEFFRAFAHCVGHGMGLSDATGDAAASNDVMSPDFSQAKDFNTFYAKVRDLTTPPPEK